MQTVLFKSGNSLAVRIPRALWPAEPGTLVEILQEGDHLTISPVRPTLAGALEVLGGFDGAYMAEGRETDQDPDRDW